MSFVGLRAFLSIYPLICRSCGSVSFEVALCLCLFWGKEHGFASYMRVN